MPAANPARGPLTCINGAKRSLSAPEALRLANLFLSYDRDDLAKAKALAGVLDAAGHDVWWYGNIRGGA